MMVVVGAPRLLKVDEVAARLAVTPRTVYRYIADGRLAAVALPGHQRRRLRVAESEIDRLLASRGATTRDDGTHDTT